MKEKETQWYALYTKPNSEFKVAQSLKEAGLEVYIPELHTQQSSAVKITPFFPCYIFVAANLGNVSPSVWQWTPGLRCLVNIGGQPATIPVAVIQLIKRKVNELNVNCHMTAAAKNFAPGDSVKITAGPLRDMIAMFEGPTKPSRRVYVLLRMLEYQRRIQLDVDTIEKISDSNTRSIKQQRRTRGRGRPITYKNAG
ncbi:MAG: hypothetical protein H6657_04260 [Ardenticatenaceae bacterium]|nr:hypothetical protein [Ardenticatenaceae bacterium]